VAYDAFRVILGQSTIPESSSGVGALGFRLGAFTGVSMACVEASSLYFGHWEEGSDGKTGNGLAGEYLPSGGIGRSGLGHDHFAIAINYGRPHLILGGPFWKSCVYASQMCCAMI
jgi:hypothetical protein